MSVWEEINGIRKMLLSSDLPEEITATVKDATVEERQKKEGTRRNLKLVLVLTKMDKVFEGREVSTTYRIPKSRTGKGQLDKLLAHLEELGIKGKDMKGKTFKWKREELEGSMKGNPRHYPIELVT